MWESFSPAAAVRALRQRPLICLLPLLWDLVKWGLARGLGPLGFHFSRWDFAVGWNLGEPAWHTRLVLPAALPSMEQLGVAIAPDAPPMVGGWQVASLVLVLVLDSLVKGGFLHTLNGLLWGQMPSWPAMKDGAFRFGWRLFAIALVWLGFSVGVSTLLERGTIPRAAALPLSLAVIVLLGVAEFITVTDDAWPPPAILAAPLVLWHQVGGAAAVLACSLALSGLLSAAGSLAGYPGELAAAGAYAVLATWVSATALHALALENHLASGESGAAE